MTIPETKELHPETETRPHRRAKIVCTLGPATASAEQLEPLVAAGMDIARLNFSHGDRADHERMCHEVRQASDRAGRAVGILADLQGPKMRLGRFDDGPVRWTTGESVRITVDEDPGSEDRVSTTHQDLHRDANPGDQLLVDDGLISLRVSDVQDNDVVCEVLEGGEVSDNKGLAMPGMDLSVPALNEKDLGDLEFALGLDIDYIALSFVRSPRDIELVHEVMDRVGVQLPVIAKVEKPDAVDELDKIVAAFDGIMVARGDLGVELPPERVPGVQKRAIQLSRAHAKPVIVATQMLDSMIHNARPTRAETSDVANAVLDGADALMLSGETSTGDYPVEAVRTMARIIEEIEADPVATVAPPPDPERTQPDLLARAARDIAEGLDVAALVAFTQTGGTARRLARLHPQLPLLAFTPSPAVRSQLALCWGVETFLTTSAESTDAMVELVDEAMAKTGRLRPGELVVILTGSPPATAGSTNLIRVHRLATDDHA